MKLPIVIPVVIYHGNIPWSIVNSTKPLFAIIKGTEKYVPDFKIEIIDLCALNDVKFDGHVECRAFLLALKYSRDSRILSWLPEIIRPFSELEIKSNQYLSQVLLYIGAVMPKKERPEFLQIIKREHRDGVSIMKTVADSFRDEGIQIGLERGRAEGWKKGREEGKLEDRLEIARKMLEKKMCVELIEELTDFTREQIGKLIENN